MPQAEIRVHTIGNTRLTVSNFGMYGSLINEGYVNPETGEFAESCEHPAGCSHDSANSPVSGFTYPSFINDPYIPKFETVKRVLPMV